MDFCLNDLQLLLQENDAWQLSSTGKQVRRLANRRWVLFPPTFWHLVVVSTVPPSSVSPLICMYTHKNVHHTVQEKYVLNKARTLVADGIHQVHFTIGGNSSGFAGNRRKEINCSNLSTSCLNLFCEILNQTYCIYSHVIAVHTRVYSIKVQCYFIK